MGIKPTPEPVDPFCELEEVEDEEDDQEDETPIILSEKEIKDEKKEKKKKKMKKMKKKKRKKRRKRVRVSLPERRKKRQLHLKGTSMLVKQNKGKVSLMTFHQVGQKLLTNSKNQQLRR